MESNQGEKLTDLIIVLALVAAITLGYIFGGLEERSDIAHECMTVGQFQQGPLVFKCGEKRN